MKNIYIVITLVFFSLKSFAMEANHRRCVVVPMSIQDDYSQDFHDSIVKYLQSADWCVSKSTNELHSILFKYKGSMDSFIVNKLFRQKIADKTQANTIIFFKTFKNENFIEIYEIDGLIFRKKYKSSFDLDETIAFLNLYKNTLIYEAVVVSVSNEYIVIDGGTRFGFNVGDAVKFLIGGKSIYHPRTSEFLHFHHSSACRGDVVMSNYKSSYVKIKGDCKKEVLLGSWVELVDIVKPVKLERNNQKNKKIFDINTGFGISLLNMYLNNSSSNNEYSGPKFSFNIAADLLLTRHIVTGLNIGGLYSMLSGESDSESLNLLGTFGNNWALHISYRYWLENFSKDSFLDLSLGYSSDYYGFNSSSDLFISGQKYYGISLKGNMEIQIFNINFFGKLRFLPNGNFSQDINYINNVDSVSGYDVEIGAYFNLFDYQNLFSLLKISKFKAASSVNQIETIIQDTGLIFGYKFGI